MAKISQNAKESVSALKESHTSGVLFAGGLEGHVGHRFAVDWLQLHVASSVILFEQDQYLEGKARGAAFLPLEAWASMWSYYSPHLIISVLPPKSSDISDKDHYQRLFNLTGADYCFADESDPNRDEKRARGKPASFTLIPHYPTLRTTFRVQKLDS